MKQRAHRRSEHGGIVGSLITLLCFALLCAIIYFARHPIMRFAAESWIVNDPAPRADAIIVLGDDNFYADRATRAAELSRQQVAPVIVASGRRLRPTAGIVELMEHDLIERGVPKEKIIRFPHDADSTREEAEGLAKLAADHHWKSVIVVTSNYHARRARYIFEKVFPPDSTISVASAHDGDFDPENWWEKRKSVKLFAREVTAILVAMWELRGEPSREAAPAPNDPQKPQVGLKTVPRGNFFAEFCPIPLYTSISAVLSSGFLVATLTSLDKRLGKRQTVCSRCPHVA